MESITQGNNLIKIVFQMQYSLNFDALMSG